MTTVIVSKSNVMMPIIKDEDNTFFCTYSKETPIHRQLPSLAFIVSSLIGLLSKVPLIIVTSLLNSGILLIVLPTSSMLPLFSIMLEFSLINLINFIPGVFNTPRNVFSMVPGYDCLTVQDGPAIVFDTSFKSVILS